MRRRLVLLLLAFAALMAASPAAALTKAQADAAALRVTAPLAAPGATVLFGLPHAVRATQSVAVAIGKRQGFLPGPKLRAAGRAVWVYWLDLAYGAKFEHPGRIVLVDDATGTVSRPRATLWYPLVDGFRPPYLRTPKAYADTRWQVWSNIGGKRRAVSAAPTGGRVVPSVLLNQIPAGSFSHDCLLMYGPYNDPMFSEDFYGMDSFAESVGLRVYYATSSRRAPLADPPGRTDVPDGDAFERNVDYLATLGGCKDILLYLDGHGTRRNAISVSAGDNAWVFPATLQLVMRQHPDVTFKVKIDSCFAGRFLGVEALRSQPNLLVLEASSSATETSYSMLTPRLMKKADGTPVTRTVADPGRGEFTHRNLVGMTSFAESQAEVQAAKASGGSLLARMLARAFVLGAGSDGGELTGRTHPELYTNIPTVTMTISAVASHTHPQPNPGYSYFLRQGVEQGRREPRREPHRAARLHGLADRDASCGNGAEGAHLQLPDPVVRRLPRRRQRDPRGPERNTARADVHRSVELDACRAVRVSAAVGPRLRALRPSC
jgi:hypothetical protein